MSDVIIRLRDCSFRYRQADADSEDGASPRGAAAGERRRRNGGRRGRRIHHRLAGPDRSLGRYRYRLDRTIAKGLEGKPCYVFHATDAPAGCPFSVLVAMDPMPERAALASGGLLSHLHFQYANDDGMLLRAESTLRKRMWYPTMCADEGTLRDQCDIVRTLHKLPPLDREA